LFKKRVVESALGKKIKPDLKKDPSVFSPKKQKSHLPLKKWEELLSVRKLTAEINSK